MTTATAKAAEKEVTNKRLSFSFRGKKFTFPSAIEMLPVDVLEAYENQHWVGFVRGVLGEKQWAVFKSLSPTIKDLNEMAKAMDDAYGAFEQ